MTAKANYTDEMVATITTQYQAGVDIELIAEAVGRSVRSVRSKLVREQVYVAPDKPVAKPRDEGPTKKEMLRELEEIAEFSTAGLEGATKAAIQAIIDFVKNDEIEAEETELDQEEVAETD